MRSISFTVEYRYLTIPFVIVDIIIIIIIIISLVYNMEGDVVLLGLMDWNTAASSATQFIPLPTTTEVCYELLTGGVRIHMYIHILRINNSNYQKERKRSL